LLIKKLDERIIENEKTAERKQAENDKLIEQKGEKEEKMNSLNLEISEFQLENLEIPS